MGTDRTAGRESVRGVDGQRTVVHSLGNVIYDVNHEKSQQGLFVER
uniref:Uncharacterized protein n=1 Tax=uncultured Nocardioidaceae bacterium TaxID=253824 RepID=A0A6J4KXZ6_9ACTN|nr:MAG: hypothetical protein AVDCRST_MAG46-629 [uncultured Nocardioidaceae bacterium]